MRRLIVGVSGATGAIIGVRLLERLKDVGGVETHVTMTKAAERILLIEHGLTKDAIKALSSHFYEIDDLTAPIASGSFKVDGMVVAPCSMKTLAGIALGFSNNLLLRAADVTLKERRKLVLVVRETPLSTVHLRNLLKVAEAGAIILPPMLSFYHKPKLLEEMVDYVVGRILDQFNIEHSLYKRWAEEPS